MASSNLNSVGVASGVPNSGTGTVSTLDGAAGWLDGKGTGLTWGSAVNSTELNSVVSGNAILLANAITNSSGLDRYMDISLQLGSAAFTGTGINMSFHIYPLNADGSTYGDGKFGTSAAGPPNIAPCAVIPLVAATQAQTGVATGIVIPPGDFKLVACNNGGVTLASGSNTIKVRTYR